MMCPVRFYTLHDLRAFKQKNAWNGEIFFFNLDMPLHCCVINNFAETKTNAHALTECSIVAKTWYEFLPHFKTKKHQKHESDGNPSCFVSWWFVFKTKNHKVSINSKPVFHETNPFSHVKHIRCILYVPVNFCNSTEGYECKVKAISVVPLLNHNAFLHGR